tara:strand:- start:691 stop:813 length:123 start_codon:yes stop_codon:yes gene_type:complete
LASPLIEMYKILLDNSSKKSVPPRKGGIGAQVEVVNKAKL